MKIASIPATLLLAALLTLVLPAQIVSGAEETSPPGKQAANTSNPLLSGAADLLAKIHKAREEVTRLESEANRVNGEDKLVAQTQIARKLIDLVADEEALVDNVQRQKKKGMDTSGLQQKLAALLPVTPKEIRNYSKKLDASINTFREALETASAEELLKVEGRLTKDIALRTEMDKAHLTCTHSMEALGLDVNAERSFLADRLSDRSESTSGRISLAREQITDLEARSAEDPDNADVKAKLLSTREKMDRAVGSLTAMIAMQEELGLETAEYKQLLIQATGDITTDIFDTKVAMGLLEGWLKTMKTWAVENGPRLIFKVILFAAILLVFKILARLTRRLVRMSMSKSKLQFSQLLQNMFISLASRAVFIIGLLIALSQLGLQIAPLLAGLGIVGFVIGFALQDVLSNFASGLMILIYRPFDMGDLIDAGGAFGTVSNMSLVSTTILTVDNQTLVVPNSKIWGDVIRNVTAQRVRRVDMVFGISYSDDIPQAEKVLAEILEKHEKVLEEPASVVKLHTLNDSSVDFIVRPWVKTEDYWEVHWDVTREVKMRFDREGISIPFPQRDVHFYDEKVANG